MNHYRVLSRSMPAIFCCAVTLFTIALACAAQAPQSDAQPSATHPIMLELFTSEGCSSCPPADALMRKLDATQPVPGAQLIVLSEHVDYWDHDGWRDPNSSAALTDRQNAYEHALGKNDPFTPQVIVDGTAEMNLQNQQQANQAVRDALANPKLPVRIGDISFDSANPEILRTHVEADGESEKRNAEVFVAVALDHVESQVLKGENSGRHLTHTAVVVQLVKIGKLQKGGSFAQDVHVKLRSGIDPKNVRVVAFVQEPGPGKMLGAALRRPTS
jgi:hypothetical protein